MPHGSLELPLVVVAAMLAHAPVMAGTGTLSPDSHVRARGAEAGRLLVEALQQSPTVARMVAEIELTDVIVTVELRMLPKNLNGQVRVAAATPSVRYLVVTLRVPNWREEMLAALGHELRHVLEIAAMPAVRDGASLATAYRTQGWSAMENGFFETEAAIEADHAVAREVAGSAGRVELGCGVPRP